jgi:hypothetical protein
MACSGRLSELCRGKSYPFFNFDSQENLETSPFSKTLTMTCTPNCGVLWAVRKISNN